MIERRLKRASLGFPDAEPETDLRLRGAMHFDLAPAALREHGPDRPGGQLRRIAIAAEMPEHDPLDPGDADARGRLPVSDRVTQIHGIVHGGVYATLAETVCSAATNAAVRDEGKVAFGQSNHTTFLRPVSDGHVNAAAHDQVVLAHVVRHAPRDLARDAARHLERVAARMERQGLDHCCQRKPAGAMRGSSGLVGSPSGSWGWL